MESTHTTHGSELKVFHKDEEQMVVEVWRKDPAAEAPKSEEYPPPGYTQIFSYTVTGKEPAMFSSGSNLPGSPEEVYRSPTAYIFVFEGRDSLGLALWRSTHSSDAQSYYPPAGCEQFYEQVFAFKAPDSDAKNEPPSAVDSSDKPPPSVTADDDEGDAQPDQSPPEVSTAPDEVDLPAVKSPEPPPAPPVSPVSDLPSGADLAAELGDEGRGRPPARHVQLHGPIYMKANFLVFFYIKFSFIKL